MAAPRHGQPGRRLHRSVAGEVRRSRRNLTGSAGRVQAGQGASRAGDVRSVEASGGHVVAGRVGALARRYASKRVLRSINEEIPGSYSGDSLMTVLGLPVANDQKQR